MIRRRDFITLIGGAAAACPLAARAQQLSKPPTIGFLGAGSGSDSVWKDWTAAFVQRLRELGWVEGRTVVIEYRWGEGRAERYADLAAEFVRLQVEPLPRRGLADTGQRRGHRTAGHKGAEGRARAKGLTGEAGPKGAPGAAIVGWSTDYA